MWVNKNLPYKIIKKIFNKNQNYDNSIQLPKLLQIFIITWTRKLCYKSILQGSRSEVRESMIKTEVQGKKF